MSKPKQRRKRGVILTPEGLEKLEQARYELERTENFGERYTYEKISELTNLDINTIKKVLSGKERVDKRSLERFFLAFKLKLTENYYTKNKPYQRQDWGEAISVTDFIGRTSELNTLETWLLSDRCRLITLQGMGGMGKTTLSIKLARQVAEKFDRVIWKSLRDAPPIAEILANLIEFISEGKETAANLPEQVGERITRLMVYLRSLRCLILLDNAESLLDGGSRAGKYRQGYEGYGELLKRIGETDHLSSLILTSREKPKEVAILEGKQLATRCLQLKGLQTAAGHEIFYKKGLSGTKAELNTLSDRYAGNPLALKVVATTIQDLFDGNIAEFLSQEQAVFGDIRDILDQQFERLSPIEREIMYWLAIAREPVSIAELQDDLILPISSLKLLEALESLSRRSLIEKNASRFTQQPVVMEYVTSRLIEKVSAEIVSQQPQLFQDHALVKATAKDYIKENQIRLILQPIINQLLTVFRRKKDIEARLTAILTRLQETSSLEPGYTAGNIVNLYSQMKTDLTGYDFANLCVWQADLRNVRLHQVNFSHADLSKSVFAENFGGIWSVAFSPDGQYLAAGDTKGDILLRRVADGQPIGNFSGHNGWVVSLAFSPDGNTLASGSCDCTAKLWNVNTSQCLHTLTEHEHEVWSVAFSPDGQTLASGCDDNQVRLWNVDTGKCIRVIQGHTDYVLSVAFSRDGQQLFSGSHDKTIKQWDLKTGKCQQIFPQHQEGVRSLGVSLDGTMLASGSNDGTVRLWNIETGECLQVLSQHSHGVWSVSFSPRGNLLASGSIDRTVRLWNIETGECLKVFQQHSNWINSVDFNSQGNLLASGSYDQTVRLWNVDTYQCWKTFQGYNNQFLSIAFSPDGQTLASGGHDRLIGLWNVNTGRVIKTFQGHSNWVFSVAFVSKTNFLASGSGDRTIKIWDINTGKLIKTLQGHQGVVHSIDFSAPQQIIASGGEDKTIKLWKFKTGQNFHTLRGHQAEIWSIAFSPDGQILASGSLDGTAKLWNVKTGECCQTLDGHTSWVTSVAISPDNQTLATTSPDRTIRLWHINTGECLAIILEPKGYSQLVAFSPDGQTVASYNHDHQIKLWNINTKKCGQILSGHTALINSITFSPDGKTLASSSEDETIELWDLASGNCVKTLKVDKPYDGMNVTGIKGLSEANINTLKALGAIDSFR